MVLILLIPSRHPALHLQPILKGFSGDADHAADADRLEQSGVGKLIGRRTDDTENGGNVILSVCSDWGTSFSFSVLVFIRLTSLC